MSGIVQVTPNGVAVAYRMPPRAAIVAMFRVGAAQNTPAQIGDSIEWTLLNLDANPANTAVLTVSVDTFNIVVGSPIVAGVPVDDTTDVSSGRFLTQLVDATANGARTITYRLC